MNLKFFYEKTNELILCEIETNYSKSNKASVDFFSTLLASSEDSMFCY